MQTASARTLREHEQGETHPGERPRAGRFERRAAPPVAERRTIVITGQPSPVRPRRRSAAQEQIAARPDRVALWAFLLGLFLILVAAATANAAPV
jgi:hypothetical protein